ncbi:sensor histidine kinase [Niabella sp. 22666]|uniref:sensor histidine kinase n=1 Tax=Niabella sp. 22666 TaxID=3453954 RepID=UPI003F842E09
MCNIHKKYFPHYFIIVTSLVCCISPRLFGQWSFKPNHYQYDASVLGTNTVYRLLEDPYGFIWMISDKGILIFNGKSFETVKIPGNEQEIVNICRYKNKVFASTYSGKLFEIDMLTLEVKAIPLPELAISEATVFRFMNVVDNKLYLSKAQGAFIILDLKKNNIPVLISDSDYLLRYLTYHDLSQPDLRYHNLYRIFNDKVFIKDTIYKLGNRTLSLFYTGKKIEKFKNVSSYLQDGSDLYVGFLESGGLVKYTNYNNLLDTNTAQSLLSNVAVGDILKDKNGNIWVSTLHDGVFFFSKQKEIQRIANYDKFYCDDIWYIQYKNGFFDIGYKQEIVDQWKNGNLYKRWVGDTSIHFNPVTLFYNYNARAIIFSSRNTRIIDSKSNTLKKTNTFKDSYIYEGEVHGAGPGSLDRFSKKLDHHYIDGSFCMNSIDMKFNTIFPLPNEDYLKGGTTGLYINNTPTQIKDRVTKARGYNKDVLACTDNGLHIKRGKRYFHITDKEGLPDNQCLQIEYHGGKYYQLLTKQGLSYIDTANIKVAGSLTAASLGKEIIIHHFASANDTIWLATSKGIFVLSEHSLLNIVKDNTTAYLFPEQLTNRTLRYTQKAFELKYNKEKSVKMIAEIINFSPKEYYVAYQIKKNNEVPAEPVQIAGRSFFVNTPGPGNYEIELFIGYDKNRIEKKLTYLLRITPFWYQTLLFKFTFGAVLVIVLLLVIRWTIRYIVKEKEKRLKEQYATLQLQSQAFFTQLNPHFIFNALTPLQSHILKNEKIESLEYLDRFSSLMRDILKNSDKTETSLKKELEFIRKYINIQQTRFIPPFVFELHIAPDIKQDNTFIPAMLLQPIIENAIEHGIKNKGTEGLITVNIQTIISKGQECLQIEIADNGVGMKHNFLKEGHALYILQKRIQTLQKQAGTIASLTHQPGNNGVGTIFTLLLSKTKNLWMP